MAASELVKGFLDCTGENPFVQRISDCLEDHLIEALLADQKGVPANRRSTFVIAVTAARSPLRGRPRDSASPRKCRALSSSTIIAYPPVHNRRF